MKAIYKWSIGAVVCAGGVGAWLAFGGREAEHVSFDTAAIQQGNFLSKVQATGTLEPQELVDVGAQVTGEIKEFGTDAEGKRIDYGSEVKAGQLLARIDDTIVELDIQRAEANVAQAKAQILSADAAVSQAKASISSAKANQSRADRDLARAKKLGVGDALSQMSYDQYVNAAETAAASLESAQAQLETALAQQANAAAQLQGAEAQLKSQLRNREYTHITAPVDGTVVVRQVNVGQTVVSSMNATTLFLVARDLSKMQIWASVNEADIAKIHPGQEVRYTVDARPDEEFVGRVNKIRPNATMSSNVVTYIVEVDIENPDRKLLPYMSANANFIVTEVKDCLMVPDAVFRFVPEPEMVAGEYRKPEPPREDKGETVVWRKVDEKHVAPVRVNKHESDSARTVITAADGEMLEAGMELVTGVRRAALSDASKASGQGNLFGPKRMQRRERSAGGVQAKGGQSGKGGNPGPPPM